MRTGVSKMGDAMKNKKGFTLIELSLSIAFIGILSITIAMIINDTIATYRRGMTLNQINTTGMDLVDDMRAAIQNSSSKALRDECGTFYDKDAAKTACENDGGAKLVSIAKNASVSIKGRESNVSMPVFGAFCTGTYSYIWNSGYFFGENDDYTISDASMASLKYNYRNADGTVDSNVVKDRFRLLKVKDDTRVVCASQLGDSYNVSNINSVFDITNTNEVVDEEPVSLLAANSDSDNNLALYDLSAAKPAASSASNTLFYSVSFILGTIQGGIDVKASGNFCATPNDYEVESFDYCAINKFNFAAQATGE